jgi:hypothetical protein
MPCGDARLQGLGFEYMTTCQGMRAFPANDPCERALKQLTALILNVCSGRLSDYCELDLSDADCTATTVGELIDEAADMIFVGNCELASECVALVNEGEALLTDDTD